jgi:hypothetical protein
MIVNVIQSIGIHHANTEQTDIFTYFLEFGGIVVFHVSLKKESSPIVKIKHYLNMSNLFYQLVNLPTYLN